MAKTTPDANLNRIHAQALLDLDAFDVAASVLGKGLQRIADAGGPPEEESEHLGLLGHLYKERFLASGNAEWLKKAITQYYGAYICSRGDRYWHGINAVALLERAARDNTPVSVGQTSEALAEEILKNVGIRWK